MGLKRNKKDHKNDPRTNQASIVNVTAYLRPILHHEKVKDTKLFYNLLQRYLCIIIDLSLRI